MCVTATPFHSIPFRFVSFHVPYIRVCHQSAGFGLVTYDCSCLLGGGGDEVEQCYVVKFLESFPQRLVKGEGWNELLLTPKMLRGKTRGWTLADTVPSLHCCGCAKLLHGYGSW